MLELKTDAELGSEKFVSISFLDQSGASSGGIDIWFTSTPKYFLFGCEGNGRNFPTNLPDAREKVWRITKTRNSGIGIQVHCNDVKVLDLKLSNTICKYYATWSTDWTKQVAKIRFTDVDDATNYYRISNTGI